MTKPMVNGEMAGKGKAMNRTPNEKGHFYDGFYRGILLGVVAVLLCAFLVR